MIKNIHSPDLFRRNSSDYEGRKLDEASAKSERKKENIQEIKTPGLRWVNLFNNTFKEIDYLRNNFRFHPLDLNDCLPPTKRSKLDEYEDYFFIVLTFPFFERQNREILPAEVDFFIGPDYLITVNDGQIPVLNKFFEECLASDTLRQKYLHHSPSFLFSEIVNKLQIHLYPILDHLNEDIENAKKKIFAGHEKNMVQEILLIKRNIISFRKVIQSHKNVIKKLVAKNEKFFIPSTVHIYLNNNLEQTKDLWDMLEGLNEYINALHSTNESLISFKLNDIMRILTIVSVTLFSLTLIAAMFGMDAKLPIVSHPYGFWIILGLMALTAIGIINYFKRKNWL